MDLTALLETPLKARLYLSQNGRELIMNHVCLSTAQIQQPARIRWWKTTTDV